MSLAEHSEGAAKQKLPGAGGSPIRLLKLLRGVETDLSKQHDKLTVRVMIVPRLHP